MNGLLRILSEATAFDGREIESKKVREREGKKEEETERGRESLGTLSFYRLTPADSGRPASL